MADYHEGNLPSASPSTQAARATQQRHDATSPYQYHPAPAYAQDTLHDGLPSSSTSPPNQYGHRPKPDQGTLYASVAASLGASSQPGQHAGSHQQHLNSSSQHHGNVSPALQYPSAAPLTQGPSGSPPGPQASNPPYSISPSPTANAPTNGSSAKKSTRIPRACDLCSQRKVKCEGGVPPCRPCRELNVPCTYDRQKKRRGPPNRAAEAVRQAEHMKRQKMESDSPSQAPAQIDGTPPARNAAQVLVSLSAPPNGQFVLDAEQCIAPLGVLQLLVDDFFTYIHPLTPFPHEPTFREAFNKREDRTNPEFLSLLASMIATLVASFPRCARLHLKSSHSYEKFPKSIILVNQCMKVAVAFRSTELMFKDVISVTDAAVSYFLCLAAGYTMRWTQCRRYLSESLGFLREMGFHKKGAPPTSIPHGVEKAETMDLINYEIGKRMYWCIFLGVRSLSQLSELNGSSRDLIIPPDTANHPGPDYPVEVDDVHILADRILPQPEGTMSTLTGFVKVCMVYHTTDDLVRIELAHGMSAYSWEQQKQYLHKALLDVKAVGESLPAELRVDVNRFSSKRFPLTTSGEKGAQNSAIYQYVPPAYPSTQPHDDLRHLFAQDESKKRSVQFEIQKANIYASILATRSYLVERYLTLRDIYLNDQRVQAQAAAATGNIVYRTAADSSSSLAAAAVQAAAEQTNDSVDELFLQERSKIVDNLYNVVLSIDQCDLEPNGGSLISKIRNVAATLLADRPDRKGPHELRNEEYLKAFLEILAKLEKTGTGAAPADVSGPVAGQMTAEDEEQELRNWADLREQQQRFTRSEY
ncbi:unnamed protein product [Discula destructiva]